MKNMLKMVAIFLVSFNALAAEPTSELSDSGKLYRFSCLAYFRDTLSFAIESPTDISVTNQFDYQVTYAPAVWSRSENDPADSGHFTLSSILSAVSKSWDSSEQKWKITKLPDTRIEIEFKANKPETLTSSFTNQNCNRLN